MKRTFSDATGTVLQREITEQEQKNSITVTRDAKGLHKIEIKRYFDNGDEAATIEIITKTFKEMKECLGIE
jgi:predicted nuclease of restriction endonuclease-like (RecB) superfamily